MTDGLYVKFRVERLDPMAQARHSACRHFVLDLDHDPHALPAIAAYARSCEADHPALAVDLRGFLPHGVPAEPARTEPTEDEARTAITRVFARRREIGEDWYREAARAVLALLPSPRVPGPLRWKFDGGRSAVLNEDNVIVGYLSSPPQRCAPSEDDLFNLILSWFDVTPRDEGAFTEARTNAREIAALYATQPTVEEAKAEGASDVIQRVREFIDPKNVAMMVDVRRIRSLLADLEADHV